MADEPSLESIVVTGSCIAREDFESPSPVITEPAVAFSQTGAISIDRTVDAYRLFVPTAGSTSNTPSHDGQANVSLRGLGVNRTLVLLDGRRLMPADGNGSVDLYILPPSLIRSVQVLTGGASSSDQGDGHEYSAGLTAGMSFAAGHGKFIE